MKWGTEGPPWMRWKRISLGEEAILVLLALIATKIGISWWIAWTIVSTAALVPDFIEPYQAAYLARQAAQRGNEK